MRSLTTLFVIVTSCTTVAQAKETSFGPPMEIPSPVELKALIGTPLVLADQKHTAFVKIGLRGADKKALERPRANVAIVLDRSGSMGGAKLVEAKRAAIMALSRLGAEDIVSVVAYDDAVQIIVPAQPLRDREAMSRAIEALYPGGGTGLFAGVSVGAAEVRRFLDKGRVNRVILMSDGLANVGPSSPGELAELGTSLGREGIAITTIGLGLGYNEDLMTKLALASDGNHAFVEHAEQLANIFSAELGDMMAVVAQDVDVRLSFAPGVKPLRALGREGVIDGNTFTTRLNQVLAGHEKMLLLEIELPATAAGAQRHIADISVSYADIGTRQARSVKGALDVLATASADKVEKATVQDVMVAAVELLANEQNKVAVALRDEGKTEEARKVLQENADFLQKQGKKYKSQRLEKLEQKNRASSTNLDDAAWNSTRKGMREQQIQSDVQQSYE